MRPFRWTQEMLDKLVLRLSELSSELGGGGLDDASVSTLREMLTEVEPYFQPIVREVNGIVHDIAVDPRVAAAIEVDSLPSLS